MKVNPVGIQSYQQVVRQDRPQSQPPDARAERGGEQDRQVVIEPQSELTKSAVAVKAPQGTYAENLSAEERQALDLLFSRFRDTARFGSGEQQECAGESGLGRVVDVKV